MWKNMNFDDNFSDFDNHNDYTEYFTNNNILPKTQEFTNEQIEKKCTECKKPILVLKSESWKKYYIPSYAKIKGEIVD